MLLYFSKKDWTVTQSLSDCFRSLPDWDYKVEINKATRIRSPEQNRRYFLILTIIDTYSHTWTDELHELFKKEFLKPTYIVSKTDKRKKRKIKPSTTRLTTEEFIIYNDKIMQFWREFFQIDWSILNN